MRPGIRLRVGAQERQRICRQARHAFPRDHGEPGGVGCGGLHLGHAPEPALWIRRILADEQQPVSLSQVGAVAQEPQRTRPRQDAMLPGQFAPGRRPQEVPVRAGYEIVAGLEDLGHAAGRHPLVQAALGRRHALHGRALGHENCPGRFVQPLHHGEGQHSVRGQAGLQLVAHGARQLHHRQALGRRPQIAFINDTFVIEAEHVGHRGPGMQQGHGPIVAGVGVEPGERR